jgi:alkaline phosphatase D
VSAGAAGALTLAKPYISRAADRPVFTHGIQAGDAGVDGGVIWTRADRPCRALYEIATTESFTNIVDSGYADALPNTDFTASAVIDELPPDQDIFYRFRLQDLSEPTVVGEPVVGRLRAASGSKRPISFVWSGDAVGQGWGIDVVRGGMRTYAAMLANRPDFFIHCGDHIYADCPIAPTCALPNGETWRNLTCEEKASKALTLDDFRGNYKYNLQDHNLRAFNAEVPMLALWDDHEVYDDWSPAEVQWRLHGSGESIVALAARGARAFQEYIPMRRRFGGGGGIYRKVSYGSLLDVFLLDMRSFRGGNGDHLEETYQPSAHCLGPKQIAWLKRELKASTATWKVIAADMPIGILTGEGIAQGDHGLPRGRELEIADLLTFIKHADIRNTAWFTADVHYTAAHYYNPNIATYQHFDPFWEFVSGPLHAGTWMPCEMDRTFGPEVMFQQGSPPELGNNLAPCFGYQFFGHVLIDPVTAVMTVTLKNMHNVALWRVNLYPEGAFSLS